MNRTLFFLLERTGTIRALDQSTLGILGYSNEELVGSSLAKLLDASGKRFLERELPSYHPAPSIRTSLRSKDGNALAVEMQFTPLHRSDPAEPLFAGIALVSETASPSPRKELSRHIVHELNNGLVAVRGFAQMIELSPDISEDIRECAREIVEAASRIQSISDELRITTPMAAAPTPKRAVTRPPPKPASAKQTALIVEDDESIAEVLCYYLQDHFSTTLVPTPEDALKEIEKGGYDLIVSDLHMPRITGLQILSHARQHQPKIPVIIVSGLTADSPEARQAVAQGAAGFIEKPSFGWNAVKEILEKFGAR